MTLEQLKQELASLDAAAQRHIMAFLVSLQHVHDDAYRQKLAVKIDQPASEFATLEELDRRLGFSESGEGS